MMPNNQWPELCRIAREVSERLIRELPISMRSLISRIPIVFQTAPPPESCKDGLAPDTMGLFVGADYNHESDDPIPPEIILYLQTIYDEADGDPVRFREEVRITILHEIGHYLGLDEDDLFKRDLD